MTSEKRTARGLYWDRAWTLVEGCTKVSPGCDHCWAESQTAIRQHQSNPKIREPLVGMIDEESGGWSEMIRLRYDNLGKPLKVTKPWIWSVWNDLFHEDVPIQFQSQAFEVMGQEPDQTFLVLTKRPERLRVFLQRWEQIEGTRFDLDNVWLGTTVENQALADRRIPELLRSHGHRFLSVEPMLGPVALGQWLWNFLAFGQVPSLAVDWVIIGPETGAHRRPADIRWIRDIARQCQTAGVPVFIKKLEVDGKLTADMSLWPEDLRLREYPEAMQ